ncbi:MULTISPECIES: TolB-like translocation protein [Klebsiella pneumoniae complex]|uniref:hypothetical protein n=1 Tax=Klebsiella pneumoniae complex TaxID=3390273 RepID=UPI001FB83539|nr:MULTISPECIES: hypothetical protein [Klebsiella]MCJ1857473.1 hypothetical protein [Klebsiella quasipneumoniae subsp. similipneumoniae]MCQ0841692.1 hypothetical protein [Klebsiella pneumoniae]
MNINEKTEWTDNVSMLMRSDKVEGGRSGAANTQAVQLANRTRWLKAQIESVKDGREHTFYTSESDPDGTIAGMGGTEEGDLFRVSLGPDSDGAFTYYWHLNGQAVKDTTLPSTAAVENLIPLNRQAKYLVAEQGAGRFPFAEDFDEIGLDKSNNVMWAFRGRQYYNYMDCVYRNIDVSELKINGRLINSDGFFEKEDKEKLTRLSRLSEVVNPDDFPLNSTAWTVLDKNRNIIFRVEDYWAALTNIDVLSQKVEQLEELMGEQKENPLIPFTETDVSGKSQICVYNRESGKQMRITDGDSNEASPRPDGPDRIVWISDREDSPPGGMFYAAYPDFEEHAYIARKKIVGWGHSFIGNGAFLKRIYELTGLPTYNFGISGQFSTGIAARQGGSPAYYTPVDGVIPASGAVNLSPSVAGPMHGFAAATPLKTNFYGVDGVFTWDGTNAVFTRDTAGNAVPVPVAAPLYVYPITTINVLGSIPKDTLFEQHDECINIFWIGRNNVDQPDVIMENLSGMVEYVKNIGQKIVILAEFNSSGEPLGSLGFNRVMELNRRYKEKYPDFYCEIDGVDIRQNFINHHNPASDDDVADIAAGLTPRSLRYDSLHPSQQINGNGASLTPELALDYGANVNAKFVHQFLLKKGWV